MSVLTVAMRSVGDTVKCLFCFSVDNDDKHRCAGITPIAGGGTRITPADPLHVPSDDELDESTRAVEPVRHETEVDVSIRGLYWPDRSMEAMCTEFLFSESCAGVMVKEFADAVTEWGWTYKRQRQKEAEELARRPLPPPLPWVAAGRRCRYIKAQRCSGRTVMSVVQRTRPPEVMRIVREHGRLRMQLICYAGEGCKGEPAREPETPQLGNSCQEEITGPGLEPTDMWGRGAPQHHFVTAA